MDASSPSIRDLLRRLRAVSKTAADPHAHGAAGIIEQLRISLTRFAGAEGFASLLRRALTLASVDVASLHSVKVSADGRLEGIEQLAAETGEPVLAVATHLLELLVTFIGEPLTLRLAREAWADTSLDADNSTSEGE